MNVSCTIFESNFGTKNSSTFWSCDGCPLILDVVVVIDSIRRLETKIQQVTQTVPQPGCHDILSVCALLLEYWPTLWGVECTVFSLVPSSRHRPYILTAGEETFPKIHSSQMEKYVFLFCSILLLNTKAYQIQIVKEGEMIPWER